MNNILKRNNVTIQGKGSKTMLMAHGFGCDQNMWRFITPAFENDYQLVLFDYVGAGKSDKTYYNPERYAALEGYAKDIIEICDTLQLKDTIFVGHSVGCMIGALACIARPDLFSSLVMVGPSPCYINKENYVGGFEQKDIEQLLETMEKNYIGWSNFLAPKIVANEDQPELSAELTASFCATDPVIAHEFATVTFMSDNRSDVAKIKKPTLILQCTEDIIAPIQVGHYLNENINGSVLKIMKATGHCPHMSAPNETINLMRQFLN